MAVQIPNKVTQADFEAFIARPENSEKIFEFISGEISEVPSNPYVSKIAGKILTFIGMYLLKFDIGHVTGADGGYIVNGDIYAPDVAYISYDRQPELAKTGFNPNPPELAIEVISDAKNSQEQAVLRRKVVNYINAGVVVWVVNPDDRTVEIYKPDEQVQVLGVDDTLTEEGILPEFTLAIKDIFPEKK